MQSSFDHQTQTLPWPSKLFRCLASAIFCAHFLEHTNFQRLQRTVPWQAGLAIAWDTTERTHFLDAALHLAPGLERDVQEVVQSETKIFTPEG